MPQCLFRREDAELWQVLSGRCNVFCLRTPRATALIDAGTRPHRRRLVRQLRSMGVDKLDHIILTHGHFDHVANARPIQDLFGGRVVSSQAAATAIAAGQSEATAGTHPWSRFLWRLVQQLEKVSSYPPLPADIVVTRDNFSLADLGLTGEVVLTPGHTAGSISLVFPELCLAGDTIFGIIPGSLYPPFCADAEMLLASWQKLIHQGCPWYHPSHGQRRSLAQLVAATPGETPQD